MKNEVIISSILNGVFSNIESVDDLKATANMICQCVKASFDTRKSELEAALKKSAPAKVKTAKAEKTPKQDKAPKQEKAPKVEKPETVEEPKPEVKSVGVNLSDEAKKLVKSLKLEFIKYAKSKGAKEHWVLRGDTKPIREIIKSYGGKWCYGLGCGAGWIFFDTSEAAKCAKVLGIKTKIS